MSSNIIKKIKQTKQATTCYYETGVIFIVVGNKHVDPSSSLEEIISISHLSKGRNPAILHPAMGKQ